ncbi:DoxX family protein [Pontibacter sp. SGAir0037]|uniref:DoxX family protein n=1 Tax=Pontibacter sp. SGAir0037 TaxID=2571030 RepID=UPI0010CD0547|nr:DoxX family protein [Pontibacter sp. SGAir0037]QCR21334.1 DoxX family protein [Pontibacter sp. SGAir0037]
MDISHFFTRSESINSAGNPVWMDVLRVALGLFLFLKGIMFLENSSEVFYHLSQRQGIIGAGNAAMLTSMVHIVGGLMIAMGFLTRLSLLLQMPILLGAILLVNFQQGVSWYNAELIISLAVLGLLVFFMIVGPGRYSIDHKILRRLH